MIPNFLPRKQTQSHMAGFDGRALATLQARTVFKRLREDGNARKHIRLLDHQRRREADHGLMRLFAENAPPRHREADLFGGDLLRIEIDADPEPFAAHRANRRMHDLRQRLAQNGAEPSATLHKLFVLQNLQGLDADGGGERIAAKGRAMAAGIEDVHQFARRDEGGGGRVSRRRAPCRE